MQLKPGLWIEGAYYVDFDNLGQLRIVGPNNHLHFGSVGVYRVTTAARSESFSPECRAMKLALQEYLRI